MIRRAILLICVAIIAAPFIASHSSLAADGGKVELTPTNELWRNETPPCVSFADCSTLPAANPYPEDTLHVALSGGEEAARTYLQFSLLLPLGARLEDGTLTLPVDTDPAHGSQTPEQADFMACLTAPNFKAGHGSLEKPPEVNCDVRKAALYSEKRVVFEVELSRFVDQWKEDEIALALLPSPRALEGTGTWHVVFPASSAEAEDPPEPETQEPREITATLNYTIDEAAADAVGTDFDFDTSTDPAPATGGSSSDFGSSSGPSFDQSTGTGTVDPGTDLGDAAAPTDVAAPQTTQPIVSFAEGFAGPGFAYPIIWALPLLILACLGTVGRALTKELYRAND